MFRSLKDSRFPKKALAGATALVALLAMVPLVINHHKSAPAASQSAKPVAANAADTKKAKAALGKVPMSFEPNVGQSIPAVKYIARGNGYNVFLTDHSAVLNLKKRGADETKAVTIELAGSNPQSSAGMDRQGIRTNYYVGPKSQWHENVPNFGAVRYNSVYKGVDAIFRSDNDNFRYDYVVKPGASPSEIRMAIRGTNEVALTDKGELNLGEGLVESKPYIYQEVNGRKVEVAGGYEMLGDGQFGFKVGNYDHSRELVIDPFLVVVAYLGGANVDVVYGVTEDATNFYAVGSTNSVNFPSGVAGTKPGASAVNGFMMGLPRAGGSATGFRTFFGSTGTTIARQAVVGSAGGTPVLLVVGDATPFNAGTGWQDSTTDPATGAGTVTSVSGAAYETLPTVSGVAPTGAGQSAFLLTLNLTAGANLGQLSLASSTWVGSAATPGSTTSGTSIVTNAARTTIWIGGTTTASDLKGVVLTMSTQDHQNGLEDGYISVLNTAALGSAFTLPAVSATYLGGAGQDSVTALALTAGATNVIAVGATCSDSTSGFPSTVGTYNSNNSGTLIPGGGNPSTTSCANGAPGNDLNDATPGAGSTGANANADAFAVEIPSTLVGKVLFGTFLGGPNNEFATGVAIDPAGAIYLTGQSNSLSFVNQGGTALPTNGTPSASAPGVAFVARLSPTMTGAKYADLNNLMTAPYSFFFGGTGDIGNAIAVDIADQAYVVATTFGGGIGAGPVFSSPQFAGPNASDPLNPVGPFNGPSAAEVVVFNGWGNGIYFVGQDGGGGTYGTTGLTGSLDQAAATYGQLFFGGSTYGNLKTTGLDVVPSYQGTYQNDSDGYVSSLQVNNMFITSATSPTAYPTPGLFPQINPTPNIAGGPGNSNMFTSTVVAGAIATNVASTTPAAGVIVANFTNAAPPTGSIQVGTVTAPVGSANAIPCAAGSMPVNSGVCYTGKPSQDSAPYNNTLPIQTGWLTVPTGAGLFTNTAAKTGTLAITLNAGVADTLPPGTYYAQFNLVNTSGAVDVDDAPVTVTVRLIVTDTLEITGGVTNLNVEHAFSRAGGVSGSFPGGVGANAAFGAATNTTAGDGLTDSYNVFVLAPTSPQPFNVALSATGADMTHGACPTTWISSVTPNGVSPLNPPGNASSGPGANNLTIVYNPAALDMYDYENIGNSGKPTITTAGGSPECNALLTITSPGSANVTVNLKMDIQTRVVTLQSFPQPLSPIAGNFNELQSFNFDAPSTQGIAKTLTVEGDSWIVGYVASVTQNFLAIANESTAGAACTGVSLTPVIANANPTAPDNNNGVPGNDGGTDNANQTNYPFVLPGPNPVSSVVVTANSVACTNNSVYEAIVTLTPNTLALGPVVNVPVFMVVGNVLTLNPGGAPTPVALPLNPSISTDNPATVTANSLNTFYVGGLNSNSGIPNGFASNTSFNFSVSDISGGAFLSGGEGACAALPANTYLLDVDGNALNVPGVGVVNGNNPITPDPLGGNQGGVIGSQGVQVTVALDEVAWETLPSQPAHGCTYTEYLTVTPSFPGSDDPALYPTPPNVANTNVVTVTLTKITQPVQVYAGTLNGATFTDATGGGTSGVSPNGLPTLTFATVPVGAGTLPTAHLVVQSQTPSFFGTYGPWSVEIATSPGPEGAAVFSWPGDCFYDSQLNPLVNDPIAPAENLSGALPLVLVSPAYTDQAFANYCGAPGSPVSISGINFDNSSANPIPSPANPSVDWLTTTVTDHVHPHNSDLPLTANVTNLAPGIYDGYVAVLGGENGNTGSGAFNGNSGNQPYLIHTVLTISGITSSTTSVPFNYIEGQPVPGPQIVTLSNPAGNGTLLPLFSFTTSNFPNCPGSVPWATVVANNNGGVSPTATLTITPTASIACLDTTIGAGIYNGSITVRSGVQTITISVPLTIVGPSITVTPVSANAAVPATFIYTVGQVAAVASEVFNFTVNPTAILGTVTVSVPAVAPAGYPQCVAGGAPSWLSVSAPTFVNAVGTETLGFIQANSPGPGQYGPYCVVLATTGNGAISVIPVSLTVNTQPSINVVSPSQFTYQIGQPAPPPQQNLLITLANPPAGSAGVPLAVAITGANSGWLTYSLSTNAPTQFATLTLIATPGNLGVGNYPATVTVTSPGVIQAQFVATLVVTSQPIFVTPGTQTFTATQNGFTTSFSDVSVANPFGLQITSTQGGNADPGIVFLATGAGANGVGAAPAWLTNVQQSAGTTPGYVSFQVNTTGLTAANSPYTASITITSPANAPVLLAPTFFNIVVTVNPQPSVTALTNPLNLTYTVNGQLVYTSGGLAGSLAAVPFVDALTASNVPGGSTLSLNAPVISCPGTTFLSATLTGTTALNLTTSPAGLPAVGGVPTSYQCTATISGSTNGTLGAPTATPALGVPVNLTVNPQPVITVSPSSAYSPGMTFVASYLPNAGTVTPAAQVLTIGSTPAFWASTLGLNTIATVTSGGNWLSIVPASGSTNTTPYSLTVTATPGVLAAGMYQGSITLTSTTPTTASGAAVPVVIPVTLNIVNTNAIAVQPIAPFTDIIGGTAAPYLPPSQTVGVTVTNGPALPIAVAVTGPNGLGGQQIAGLFTASLASNGAATLATQLTVSISPAVVAGLGAGTYTANISLTSPNVGTVNVPVSITVYAAPVISPLSALTFASTINGFTTPAPAQLVSPVYTGLPPVDSFGLSAAVTTGASFLSVTNGSVPFTVSVNQPATPGVYNGSITISGPVGSGVVPVTFNVTLTVYAQPFLSSNGSAALSYTIGQIPVPVSGIVTIGGTVAAPDAPIQGLTLSATTGNCGWVSSVGFTSGTSAPTTVAFVPVSPGVLNTMLPGVYNCSATVNGSTTGALGAPSVTTVATASLTILPQPIINAVTTPVVLTSPNGNASAQIIVTTSNPLGLTVSVASAVVTPVGGTWLSAVLSGVGSTQTLTISGNPMGLVNGTYTGNVTLTASNGASFPAAPVVIPVSFLIGVTPKPSELGIFRGGNTFLLNAAGNNVYTPGSDIFITGFAPPGGFVAGDIAVSGDWNASGHAKVGVYRPSSGTWWLDFNGDGVFGVGDVTYQFGGLAGDIPVTGDWSGNGSSKIGIFRSSGGVWLLDVNGDGAFDTGDAFFPFGGLPGDVPVVGSWTGNGITSVGVVRKYFVGGVPQGSPFYWILDSGLPTSGSSAAAHQPFGSGSVAPFAYGGLPGDVFVTGDWLGTGTNHAGVYRSGNWIEDTTGAHTYDTFYQYGGLATDTPLVGVKPWR